MTSGVRLLAGPLEAFYQSASLTISTQDGPQAGQSVPVCFLLYYYCYYYYYYYGTLLARACPHAAQEGRRVQSK